MKAVVVLIVGVCYLLADSPSRLWTTPNALEIETTEGKVAAPLTVEEPVPVMDEVYTPLQEVPVGKDIEDLPLAKTYPVNVDQKNAFALPRGKQITSARTADTTSENLSKLQAIIEREVAQQQSKAIQHPSSDTQSKSAVASDGGEFATPVQSTEIKEQVRVQAEIWWALFREHAIMTVALVLSLLMLGILLVILKKRNGLSARSANHDNTIAESVSAARLLERFSILKGEIRQCFLERKQNILFNDDFTQYQKAKALIELEKEYTQIEFMELPKLFSDDFERFLEAQRLLSAREELKEIIENFIETTLNGSHYTKRQKEHILRNMKRYYNTAHHTWHYRPDMDRGIGREETAYLLQ